MRTLLCCLFVIPTIACHRGVAASFTGLGFLHPTDTTSRASAVSRDGSWVGGGSRDSTGREEAFRWSSGGGMQGLGILAGQPNSKVFGISANGQVATGSSGSRPFLWSPTEGLTDIGLLPGTQCGDGWGISGDGLIVAGGTEMNCGLEDGEPFRWTSGGGIIGLGYLPGRSRGEALAISEDGTVIVGYSGSSGFGNVEAFRRGTDGVMRGLGVLPGHVTSVARHVSTDGSVIVGDCRDSSGNSQAFTWTQAGGMRGLGFLSGLGESGAEGVSGNGTIVVGDASFFDSATGKFISRAFLWDATNGMRDIQAILTNDFGLNLSGWSLERAMAISGDGTSIVGTGTDPQGRGQAWIARMSSLLPSLRIAPLPSAVVVSWPIAFSNFTLHGTVTLGPLNSWSGVTNQPVARLNEFVVTNALSGSHRFYRLEAP